MLEDAPAFLAELQRHNDREWFRAHQDRFEQVIRTPALDIIEELGAWMEAADLPYVASAKKVGGSLAKIQRDVRFSNDKTPYHDHVTLHFTHRDNTPERPMPAWGVRFDAESIGLGGGIWQAATPVLNRIRDAIVADPQGWQEAKQGVALDGDRLKTAPRGYDPAHPQIDDLRLKSFLGTVPMVMPDLGDLVVAIQSRIRPVLVFNDWLAAALH